MAIKPEVLDALLAAGASAEMIVAAVKADLATEEQKKLVKRAKDAERQRKSRANRSASRDVTVTGCDSQDVAATPPDPPIPPVSPKGDTAPQGAKQRRGSKIEETWTPPAVAELGPEFRKLAEQWTADSYRTEAAAFRSYWLGESGAKACKSNWKRAWENRIAQIHGKVMRDQRFASSPTGPPAEPSSFLDHVLERNRCQAEYAGNSGP
jgi:hypothetical protein